MPDATLIVKGRQYLGWTDITLTRSMEQLADKFDISFSERWAGQDQPVPILEGDRCKLRLGSKDVVAGYVDDTSISYDANTHAMRVEGRSFTGDLCDCAAIHSTGSGQWTNASLLKIATDLCDPFGISVQLKTDGGATFRTFAIQDGETAHECLERASRMRGVLLTSNAEGQLVIARASSTRVHTKLQYGVNIIRGERSGSWKERFKTYIVKDQQVGDDSAFGEAVTTIKRSSTDAEIDRYRPMITMAEGQESGTELQKRADWERNVRAGRGQRISYQVQGWEHADGLWEPNTLVRVVDPFLKVNKELLLVCVRQTKSEAGTFSDLELTDPKAMSVEPLVPKTKRNDVFL